MLHVKLHRSWQERFLTVKHSNPRRLRDFKKRLGDVFPTESVSPFQHKRRFEEYGHRHEPFGFGR